MFGFDEEQSFQGPRSPNMNRGVVGGEEEEEDEEEEQEDHSSAQQTKAVTHPYVPPNYKLKSRLRWSGHLHASFVDAVYRLGGPYRATPKAIMNIMDVEGITLFHVKSHLQKYRLGKYGVREWRDGTGSRTEDKVSEVLKGQDSGSGDSTSPSLSLLQPYENEICELSKELKAKKEAQEKLLMRNEVKKHLQLRREAQSRYLSGALENACEKLAPEYGKGCGAESADYAGVSEQSAPTGSETLGSIPIQKDQDLNSAYHMTGTMQLSFENQLGSFENQLGSFENQLGVQPPSEGYFPTGDHLISDGHSGTPVLDFLAFNEDVNEEVESLDVDPAEAYLIWDTAENGGAKC